MYTMTWHCRYMRWRDCIACKQLLPLLFLHKHRAVTCVEPLFLSTVLINSLCMRHCFENNTSTGEQVDVVHTTLNRVTSCMTDPTCCWSLII